MAKAKENPEMEGNVSRKIDFNLKKEDLMLLILEGRKEVMETEIGNIQNTSTKLKSEMVEAQKKFNEKIKTLCFKSLSKDAKNLAKTFGKKEFKEQEEIDVEKVFRIDLRESTDITSYTKFLSSPIGDGKGGTYIKTQSTGEIRVNDFISVEIYFELSLYGKTYANKSDLFSKSEVRSCNENSRDYILVDELLSKEFQHELKEFKELKAIAENLGKNESLLSDILAEYDLFNRNQPRSKAKLIKEVLGRDVNGQALLENIVAAAQGTKLLA